MQDTKKEIDDFFQSANEERMKILSCKRISELNELYAKYAKEMVNSNMVISKEVVKNGTIDELKIARLRIIYHLVMIIQDCENKIKSEMNWG